MGSDRASEEALVIPVIIVPTLYRTDLLVKLVESVDHEVGAILIIDNGGSIPPDLPGATVVTLPHNIGVGAAWNLAIKLTPRAPWWLISNDDIEFNPGELAEVERVMSQDPSPRIGFLLGMACFAINQAAIQEIGFFDENFHPAYFEDNDTAWRAKQAGVPIVEIEGNPKHVGSATIRGHEIYNRQNGLTFSQNMAYYVEKWGGRPDEEVYTTPFNKGGDIGSVRLQMDRLNQLAWARLKPSR